jgi:septal ring factor EnvC (AmiA/AmiB activator)
MGWFTQTTAAWTAIGLTSFSGIFATAVHWGSTNQQIATIEKKQDDTDAHVSKHDDQLSTIQQQNAASAQALNDIKDQLNRIEKKL